METNPARFGCRHVMEMISSRPVKGAFALPFLGTIPSTKERVTPLGTPTNRPPIGYRHLAEDGSRPRLTLPAALYEWRPSPKYRVCNTPRDRHKLSHVL